MNKLNVQAIFESIDGEVNGFDGAGQITTFIRLKGCNIKCNYCDTKYAQDPEDGTWRTVQEVYDAVHTKKVTITGGEPLLQRELVEELCRMLIFGKKFCNVSIETNGTIKPEYFTHSLRYIMDCKLLSSGMSGFMSIERFDCLRDIDVIKFVIADEEDYQMAKDLLLYNPSWKAKKVFSPAVELLWQTFSPGSVSGFVREPEAKISTEWPCKLVEMMIKDKVEAQFSLQIHKVLWPGVKEER